jgi:hypothetical protein
MDKDKFIVSKNLSIRQSGKITIMTIFLTEFKTLNLVFILSELFAEKAYLYTGLLKGIKFLSKSS